MRFVFADFVDKRVEERHEPLIFFFGMWDMSDNVHVSVLRTSLSALGPDGY